jgi:cytoskeletal protein CcmA (bactofilin family)
MPEVKTTPVQNTSSMSVGNANKGNTPGRRVLTVGNDILLKGEIATCDRLVIEGKVDATLNDVHTVEISETGSFKGSAHIEDAEISGLFEGDLIVRNRLVIYATGKVRGKITYGEIEIEPSIYVKEGYGYMLSLDDWMRIGSTDMTFKRPGQGDEFFRDLENSAAYELRLYSDQAIFCMAPGKSVLLKDIVNSNT